MKIMITGGVKSGKSGFALQLAEREFPRKLFLATATAFDDEMRERIEKHRAERDASYTTVEEPVNIDSVEGENLILDDVTVWMSNLFLEKMEDRWEEILSRFLDNLGRNALIITNEVGLGNIPMDPETRKYNRLLGAANTLIASRADRVYFMISGIPLQVK